MTAEFLTNLPYLLEYKEKPGLINDIYLDDMFQLWRGGEYLHLLPSMLRELINFHKSDPNLIEKIIRLLKGTNFNNWYTTNKQGLANFITTLSPENPLALYILFGYIPKYFKYTFENFEVYGTLLVNTLYEGIRYNSVYQEMFVNFAKRLPQYTPISDEELIVVADLERQIVSFKNILVQPKWKKTENKCELIEKDEVYYDMIYNTEADCKKSKEQKYIVDPTIIDKALENILNVSYLSLDFGLTDMMLQYVYPNFDIQFHLRIDGPYHFDYLYNKALEAHPGTKLYDTIQSFIPDLILYAKDTNQPRQVIDNLLKNYLEE